MSRNETMDASDGLVASSVLMGRGSHVQLAIFVS